MPEQRDSKCKVKWTQEEVSDTEGQLRGMEVMEAVGAAAGVGADGTEPGVCLPHQYDEGEALLKETSGPSFSLMLLSIPIPCQY